MGRVMHPPHLWNKSVDNPGVQLSWIAKFTLRSLCAIIAASWIVVEEKPIAPKEAIAWKK
jgi:hypothetical protein